MFEHKIIKLKVKNIKNNKEVLNVLSNALIKEKIVKSSFKNAVIDREMKYPTGLEFEGYSIALPHTECEHVNKSQIAIMTLEKPVKFYEMTSLDKEIDVKIIFMLALKNSEQHIKILQKVMKLVQDKDTMNKLYSFDDSEVNIKKLIKLLEEYEFN